MSRKPSTPAESNPCKFNPVSGAYDSIVIGSGVGGALMGGVPTAPRSCAAA